MKIIYSSYYNLSDVSNGRPLPTYKPSSQFVPLGGTARLFCEVYIGRANVPDVRYTVTWIKSDNNKTLTSQGRISLDQVSRSVYNDDDENDAS